MKFTCIIDTCSYIYLNKCEVFRKTALQLLHNSVNIIFSPAIEKEIVDHYESQMPSMKQRRANIKRTTFYSIAQYEIKLFGNSLQDRAQDKGERDNLSLILDQYLSGKKVGTVYLTDDDNAIQKVICDQIGAFPVFKLWSSYDVIIFLYILKAIPEKALAENAIRDINNIMVPPSTNHRMVTTQNKIKKVTEYLNYINIISNTIN